MNFTFYTTQYAIILKYGVVCSVVSGVVSGVVLGV